ncbi:NUDIX domain-containing protein [Kitasatospora sp. NPDC059463]|uniref:NUDIX domain-containing protein n=1 Tax=unclassified Kitasatospora TaxID=2633591 RepID=UPI0036B8B45B
MNPSPTDPVAWNAYLAEGNARQARKRVAADVILRDAAGRVLVVDPTYKEGWDLPGGMVEANEPPHEAAVRELREELGVEIAIGGLLVVDWVPPHGPWDDQLAFIFSACLVGDTDEASIEPLDGELAEAVFLPVGEIPALLRPRLRKRFGAALRALDDGRVRYLHDGLPTSGL